MVRNNRLAFATLVGEDLVDHVFSRDPRFRFWTEATGIEWIDAELVAEGVFALARAAERDPEPLNAAATRIGTAQSFRTVWRMMLRLTSDEALIARSGLLYARAFDTGRVDYERVREGHALLRLSGWPNPPRIHMVGLAAGIETMLRIAGRPAATVSYQVVESEHRFEVAAAG